MQRRDKGPEGDYRVTVAARVCDTNRFTRSRRTFNLYICSIVSLTLAGLRKIVKRKLMNNAKCKCEREDTKTET